jgi:hypothetical protein
MNWTTTLKLIQTTKNPMELLAAAVILHLGGEEGVKAIVGSKPSDTDNGSASESGNTCASTCGSDEKRPDKAQRYRERNREKLAAKARERRKREQPK